jgi:hypothetical protein
MRAAFLRAATAGLTALAAIGSGAASGLSTATYTVEVDPGDGVFKPAGTLTLSSMTPNLAGWSGSYTDAATGTSDAVTGIDSAMLSGRSGDYLALSIGKRVCLVESMEPQATPRVYSARCVEPGETFARGYRLTETSSEGVSVEH